MLITYHHRKGLPVNEPNQPKQKLPTDFPEVIEISPTYVNWFLGTGSNEGVRITFGEAFDDKDEFVVGHVAVMMSLQTSIKLHNMLSSVIQTLVSLKQQELQSNIARALAPQDRVIPDNEKN